MRVATESGIQHGGGFTSLCPLSQHPANYFSVFAPMEGIFHSERTTLRGDVKRHLPRHLHCLRTAATVPTLIRPFFLSNSKRCLIIYQTHGILLKGTLLTPEHRLK